MSLGIPAIKIGSGGTGGRAHSLEEWIDVAPEPSIRGMAAGLATVLAVAGSGVAQVISTPAANASRNASDARYSGTCPRSRIWVLRRYAAFRTSSPDWRKARLDRRFQHTGWVLDPDIDFGERCAHRWQAPRYLVRDRTGDQCRRSQAAAARYRHRPMRRSAA